MKPSTLQQKASALLALDARRKAHHYALSKLHASPVTGYDGYDETEQHEKRGLAMWRRLKRLEREARRGAEAYCNGDSINLAGTKYDFSSESDAWERFVSTIQGLVKPVFGEIPDGFYVNGDARGMSLCINAEKSAIPQGMQRNWGGDGLLAAEITL